MPSSVVSKGGKRAPNLWNDAYEALREEDEGRERLRRLHAILREHLGKPKLRLRSEEGYSQLRAFIDAKARGVETSKASSKIAKICHNMLQIQDLVAAGTSVGGPYVAIPAAALFLAFSLTQGYLSEKEAKVKLAEKVTHYTVLGARCHERIKAVPGDDKKAKELKSNMHMVCIGLYKAIISGTAELMISLHDDRLGKLWKSLTKGYDWDQKIQDLDEMYNYYEMYRDEMGDRRDFPLEPDPGQAMGPGPRNPLHWAVAFVVPERVSDLLRTKEYPINALTPRKWTAAHLGAKTGNKKIMSMLMTADGIDVRIKNVEGRTPLHIAALNNKVDPVKLLLERNKGIITVQDERGRTAFLLAAQKGYVRVLKALKAHGQNMNEATPKNGWTGLHLAAENGHVDAVKYLVENGADKNRKVRAGKRKGCSARQIAEQQGKAAVVEVL